MIGDVEMVMRYQFQVVAIAMLGGMEFVGNRSVVDENTMLALTTAKLPPPPTSAPQSNHD
jgi:hypothetical protein